MNLVVELKKVVESTPDEINEIIRQHVNESFIDEYPATGVHYFYTEFFEHREYGYNVAINMFFNMEHVGDVHCCKESLFLSVTPSEKSVILFSIVNVPFKSRNPVCFTKCVSDNEIEKFVLETHDKARNQIDSLLRKMNSYHMQILKTR